MNATALEIARDALIKALDAVNEAIASSTSENRKDTRGVFTKTSASILPRIIRFPEVKARTGMSRSFIYSQIKAGTFPAPISLGPRAVCWDSDAVEHWSQNKLKK